MFDLGSQGKEGKEGKLQPIWICMCAFDLWHIRVLKGSSDRVIKYSRISFTYASIYISLFVSLSSSFFLLLVLSCAYYAKPMKTSKSSCVCVCVCMLVCVCVSFLIFLILLLLLFTIYLLKLLISLFAEERKPRGNLAYCYCSRCFLSPATVARCS